MADFSAASVSAALRKQGLMPVSNESRREGVKVVGSRPMYPGANPSVRVRIDIEAVGLANRMKRSVEEALTAAGFEFDASEWSVRILGKKVAA